MATVKAVESVIELDVSQLDIKSDWNVRSGDFVSGEGAETEETASEFGELVESIRTRGQDDPVVVLPAAKNAKYKLIQGFRRVKAVEVINQRKTAGMIADRTPLKVKAIVRDLGDREALEANLRENVARENLRPADIAFGVARVKESQQKEKTFTSDSSLAQNVGLKQAYCSKLLLIVERVDPEIFTHWRGARAPIPVLAMYDISKLDRKDQREAYDVATGRREAEGGRKGGPGRGGNVVERAIKEAEKVATLLGTLEALEAIESHLGDYTEHIEDIVSGGKYEALTRPQWKKVAKAAAAAHAVAMKEANESEDAAE